MNEEFVKELAFELYYTVSTRDVVEGFTLMEYTRWVLPYFILMLCTNSILILCILQHAQRP
jgi:hypothetical protein